jgi:hypothetical protein
MRKSLLLIVPICFALVSKPVMSSDFSNFFTPWGFRAPLLKQGQYALNSLSHYYRSEFKYNYNSGSMSNYESVLKNYSFSLNGVYAVTDKVVFQGNLDFNPAQTRLTSWQTWTFISFPEEDTTLQKYKYEQHSDFNVSPQLVISFRPKTNMEFYGTFYFDKRKLYTEEDDEGRTSDESRKTYYSNVGFTMLGGANTTMPAFGSVLSDFLRPYGFRTPMLKQGQYALNLNSYYYRYESELHSKTSLKPSESTYKRYCLSLNGVYALTDGLIFRSDLDFYPAQIRETYDRADYHLYFYKVHSDFAISPNITVSFRPKSNMEFYNTFLFAKENLESRPNLPSYEQRDERRKTYYFDFGFTVLGGLKTARISSSELSNFLTPYGFKTPLLKQGQYAINLGSFYERDESEYDIPSTSATHYESVWKNYYFLLNGIYAATDRLIFESTLCLYPGQTIFTSRHTEVWYNPLSGNLVTGEDKDERNSSFAISPRFNVSFRPKANIEFYGIFYFNKEKAVTRSVYTVHPSVPLYEEEYTADERQETFYFDFGVTILGGLW